jgi:hypothetical protein
MAVQNLLKRAHRPIPFELAPHLVVTGEGDRPIVLPERLPQVSGADCHFSAHSSLAAPPGNQGGDNESRHSPSGLSSLDGETFGMDDRATIFRIKVVPSCGALTVGEEPVAKLSERLLKRPYLIGALFLCQVGPALAAQTDGHYKPPVKGLQIVFADLVRGKAEPGEASMTQKITAVKGDEASFTQWTKRGGLVFSEKHRRVRSLFSYRIEQHNGTILYDFDKAALRRLWPLAPGKHVELAATLYIGPEKTVAAAKAKLRRGRKVVSSYAVVKAQSLKLPAGQFSTFLIQRTWRSEKADGSVAEAGVDRIWLATKLGWIVRLERRTTAGPGKGRVQRLVAVSVKFPK